MKLSPKSEALAYRIWAYCEPRGWNVTPREIGDEIGICASHVVQLLWRKGWHTRVRADSRKARTQHDLRREQLDFAGRDWDSFREHLSDLATINA